MVMKQNAKILIVDDEEDIRLSMRLFLSQHFTTVQTEANPFQLPRILRNEEYDLILLDMQMPRLDGYQTAARLRKMGFDKPIIALTADAMHGDMNKCLESGCNAYLPKPIDAAALLDIVAEYAT